MAASIPALQGTSIDAVYRWAGALVRVVEQRFQGVEQPRDPPLRPYAKANLPDATAGYRLILVTDDVGGAVPAFNDGTNWRRVTDRAVIS